MPLPALPSAEPVTAAPAPSEREWRFGGWSVQYRRGPAPTTLPTRLAGTTVLFVSLRGRVTLTGLASGASLLLNAQEYALAAAGPQEVQVAGIDADSERLLIGWPAEEVRALLSNGQPEGTAPLAAGPAADVIARPVSLLMHHVVREIGGGSLPPSVQPLWLRAKALELLALASTPAAVPAGLSEYDREQLRFAREYLTAHVQAPPSLPGLARLAGLNEHKLKRGFKALFGLPVFAYLAEYRLLEARRLLTHGGWTATEIAFELGYSSLPHFSTAFRKRFGVPPSNLVPGPRGG